MGAYLRGVAGRIGDRRLGRRARAARRAIQGAKFQVTRRVVRPGAGRAHYRRTCTASFRPFPGGTGGPAFAQDRADRTSVLAAAAASGLRVIDAEVALLMVPVKIGVNTR